MIQLDPSAVAPAIPTVDPAAKDTAQAFEAVFLGQMAQAMMGSADAEPGFSGGHGEEMFRGVLAEQIGSAMAARGGIGLAPAVLDAMIRMQGGQ